MPATLRRARRVPQPGSAAGARASSARRPRTAPASRSRHSRIYILPTRRGLALIGTLAIMLVTSMNYALALGFVATFVLSGLVGRRAAQHVPQPGRARDSARQRGRDVRRRTPPVHADARPAARRTRVAICHRPPRRRDARRRRRRRYDRARDVRAGRAARGRVPLGRVTITSDFPLGLWRGWAYAHFPAAGIAYPRPSRRRRRCRSGSPGADASRAGRAEDADLAGLREYQRGDPLQRVAWKAVARGAGWYTKAFDGARRRRARSCSISQRCRRR